MHPNTQLCASYVLRTCVLVQPDVVVLLLSTGGNRSSYSFGYPTHSEDQSEHSTNQSFCGKGLGRRFLKVAEMTILVFLCGSTRI